MKILKYTYTTIPLLVLDKIMIQDLALVTVVIETGIKGWKAYQAVIPYHEGVPENIVDDPKTLQGVAMRGRKLKEEIAFSMFPEFEKKMYNK